MFVIGIISISELFYNFKKKLFDCSIESDVNGSNSGQICIIKA